MSLYTQSKVGFPQPGLDAAREGRALVLYVNEKTGIDSEVVLTDATLLKVVATDIRLVIKSLFASLSTADDAVRFDIVTTASEDGSGAVVPITGYFHLVSGAAATPSARGLSHTFDPPLVIERTATAHAVSVRALGNDQATALSVQLHGWEETDTDTN